MARLRPSQFVRNGKTNAALAWGVVAALAVTGIASLATLRPVAAVMAFLFAAVAVVPAVARGSWTRAYPWSLLVLSASPTYVRVYGTDVVHSFAVFVGVATLALLAVLDLHLLTDVQLSTGFTTAFVFVATVGLTGFWAVFQWALDLAFGSGFFETNDRLMWGFVTAAVAGVLTALVFERYLLYASAGEPEVDAG